MVKEAIASFRSDRQAMDPKDHYMDGVIVYGTPERVVDQLSELETTLPLDYLLLSPLSEKTFDLFTERVLPELT